MARKSKEDAKQARRERTRKRANERNSDTGGRYLKVPDKTNFLKVKKGTFRLDIIPYTVSVDKHPDRLDVGEIWYRRIFYVHKDIGAENMRMICPAKTAGRPCPICEERAKLMAQPNADGDIVKALRPSERELFNVIDLDDERKGVQLFDMATFLFGQMLDEHMSEGKIENCDFYELEGGKTLVVRFKENSFGGRTFPMVRNIDFEERDADYEEVKGVMDLDKLLVIPTYKQLQQAFFETTDADEQGDEPGKEEAGDDDDRAPVRKKRPAEDEPSDDAASDDAAPEKEDEPPADENEPEPEPEKEKEVAKKPKKEAAKEPEKEDGGEECPHDGTFGEDCDDLKGCDDCDLWDACAKERDKREGK